MEQVLNGWVKLIHASAPWRGQWSSSSSHTIDIFIDSRWASTAYTFASSRAYKNPITRADLPADALEIYNSGLVASPITWGLGTMWDGYNGYYYTLSPDGSLRVERTAPYYWPVIVELKPGIITSYEKIVDAAGMIAWEILGVSAN